MSQDQEKIATTPEEILIELSRILNVDVRFEPDPNNAQKVSPIIDVSAILSKFISLMVYVGWNVPPNIMPAYTRVHADVEYWKKQFQEANVPTAPKEEPKPAVEGAGASESLPPAAEAAPPQA